jgi:hypothetical protein
MRTSPRNAFNLDGHALWQLLDGDTAPRGLVRKVLLEDTIHLSEVRHVVEEHVDLDNAIHLDARLRQDANNVLAALLRLVCDATFDQVALGVGGDLARDEYGGACDDGLGLREG